MAKNSAVLSTEVSRSIAHEVTAVHGHILKLQQAKKKKRKKKIDLIFIYCSNYHVIACALQ